MHDQRHARPFFPFLLVLGLLAASCGSAEDIGKVVDNLGRGGNGGGPGGAGGAAGDAGGPGGRACGGPLAGACAPDEFCDHPAPTCGRNGAAGVCRRRPQACTQQFAPVCGCDGKTYGNDCTRASAGVSKQHDGECRQVVEVGEGEQCGGFRPPPQRVCAKGLKCNDQPGRCGSQAADAPGICEAVPTACTKEFRPVCGCDGRTYGNDCTRKAAGVSLDHEGECRPGPGRKEGEMCGGIAGLACDKGLFCEPPAGSCRVADVAGVCKRIPQACTAELRPVCGCDGRTHGNDCARQLAGVGKDHDGECAPRPARLLPSGVWGGEHVVLTARDPRAGATIEFDCARGTIQGPLAVQADGSFKWAGRYTREGGPDPGGGRPSVDATYFGTVHAGSVMELSVTLSGAQHPAAKLTLGQPGRLFKCQ